MIALIIGTTIATVLGLLIFHTVSKKKESTDGTDGDLSKITSRLTEIEKWCEKFTSAFNQNTDSYNRNKNAMLEEIKDLTKFVGDAGELVNSNVDDIKDIEESLLELKNTLIRLEKKKPKRKIRYNISANKY